MFGLFSKSKNPPRQKEIAAFPVRVPVRGKYDSAQTTVDNRRHWAMADGLGAGAANSRSVRRILRNRARYEVANNSYAKGIVDTLANDVIGSSITLQIKTNNTGADSRIEKAFNEWAREINLASKLRTMRRAKAVEGEAFAVLITNPKLKSEIKLDIRLVEADQVTDPDSAANHADGIRFDEAGNPISYSILREHPGDGLSSSKNPDPPTPASAVIHWFSCERPGQVRGIPDIMPALPLFAQLRRFTLAVIAAAETAADFAAVMYTNASAAGESDEVDPFLPIDIEQRTMMSLPAGWQMEQFKPEQPTSTYAEFKKEIINEIARCLNMPFNIAACNSSGYNYSSGKLDHQTYYKSIWVQQSEIESIGLDKILAAWLEEAALVPNFLPSGPYIQWMGQRQWFMDGQEHVDPLKEADAQAVRLTNHTTTLADEWGKSGHDWEPKLRQRARELELMAELGLSIADAAKSKSKTEAPENDDAEESQTADAA